MKLKSKMNSRFFKAFALLALSIVALSSCKDDDDGGGDSGIDVDAITRSQLVELEEYLASNSITYDSVAKGGYAYYRELVDPKPEAKLLGKAEAAKISFTISDLEGTEIGSSDDDGIMPVIINTVNASFTPLALYYAMQDMRLGETVRLYVPGFYGYRNIAIEEKGVEVYEPLIFTLTIEELYTANFQINAEIEEQIQAYVSQQSEAYQAIASDTTFIQKAVLTAGSGTTPSQNDTAYVKYTGYYLNGQVFDSNTNTDNQLNVLLADNNFNVIPGFRDAVLSMQVGEKSKFVIPAVRAYGQKGSTATVSLGTPPQYSLPLNLNKELGKGIPPNTPIIFEITLEELNK